VSAEFVDEATQPSQDLAPGYGFLWWLLGGRGGDTAPGQGEVESGGPQGYAALGLGNQVSAVFPERELVVTRMGDGGTDFGVAEIAEWAATVERED
jgi:CubicO group peptidase (beta-lactamase class C family)